MFISFACPKETNQRKKHFYEVFLLRKTTNKILNFLQGFGNFSRILFVILRKSLQSKALLKFTHLYVCL